MAIRKQSRKGAFVVGVIVVMIVVATLVMAFTRSLITQSRAARTRARHRQASWLAESGLSRGAARLAADAMYAGETWTIAADQLEGGAEVKIEIASLKPAEGEQPGKRTLRATARYPLSSPTPATVETKLELSPSISEDES